MMEPLLVLNAIAVDGPGSSHRKPISASRVYYSIILTRQRVLRPSTAANVRVLLSET